MSNQIIPAHPYLRLRKSIEGELLAGAKRVRRSYREEVVRTMWNIGKLLRGPLGLLDLPSPENAALVERLCGDLDRSESFFYSAAKFHRLYPAKPPLALSWSHYALLICLGDPKKRLALERKAVKEGINAQDLRMFTRVSDKFIFGAGTEKAILPVERGRLYHYRATTAPVNGRVLIDIGFGVERDVRCDNKGSFHSGLIVRAVKDDDDFSAKISPFKKSRLYTYAATLARVIDGDTIVARVDLGFRSWKTETFRLRGIDTPEMTCALGRKAKAEVVAQLTPCACLVIKTYKQEKYGRFLADVFYQHGTDDREQVLRKGAFLNQKLLDEGLAVPYALS